jgi:hypothetical protein
MCDIVDPVRASAISKLDLGGCVNFRNVFGNVPVSWAFPIRYGIEGDGLTYQRSSGNTSSADQDATSVERV